MSTGGSALQSLIQIIGWVDFVVFSSLAVVSFIGWRRNGGAAVGWLSATFAVLAFVVTISVFTPEESDSTGNEILTRTVVATLVLFPYLLFRFVASLRPIGRSLELLAGGLTGACVVASLLFGMPPEEGESQSLSFVVFIVLILVQWTALSSFAAVRLWRMGSGQPTIVRHRMRLLSLGSAALNLALILAGVTSASASIGLDLVVQFLGVASALLFFAGFTPPGFVRVQWRREEEEVLRKAIVKLMVATSSDEVTSSILPHTSAIVGGRAAALVGRKNEVLDSHQVSDEMLRSLPELIEENGSSSGFAQDVIVLDVPFGKLVVWGTPATPVFGQDEIELLQSLAVFTGLALERTELFQRERRARRSLEKANRELESASAELEQEVAERRRAEEDLIESQMQLAEAQELTMLGSWRWDIEKDRIYWSDQMYSIHGVDPATFNASFDGLIEIVHPDDREAMRSMVERLHESEDSFSMEHRITRQDGKSRVMYARGKVMRDIAGRPIRVIGTSQDITKRKQAETALRASEMRFRRLAESSNEGIVSIDDGGRIIFWNRGAQNVFGYWEEEVIGETVQMLMPVRFRPEHERGFARFLETGESRIIGTTVEVEGLRKDGTEFPLELSLAAWTVDEERFFTGILRDISDRKNAEAELRRVSRQQELILNAAGEGIFGVDANGITQFVNPAAAALLGYESNELIGRPQHSAIHHSRPDGTPYPPEDSPILQAVETGVTARVGDEVFWKSDGSAIEVEYIVTPITEDEAITGCVVVFWERTSGSLEKLHEDHPRHGAHPVG
ncbi:MAG: PAS domain S-box protein [Actinobacteria bacterium]|nr:PAS domain S-box protein [Actinomycetota bacterium]